MIIVVNFNHKENGINGVRALHGRHPVVASCTVDRGRVGTFDYQETIIWSIRRFHVRSVDHRLCNIWVDEVARTRISLAEYAVANQDHRTSKHLLDMGH